MLGKKKFIGLLATLILIPFASGIAPEASAAGKKYLSMGTGNPGGTNYFIGAGFSKLINKFVPEVRIIAESTAAAEENLHYLMRKKLDLGVVSLNVIQSAVEKKMDLSGVRIFALGMTSDRHWIVRKDSPIKSVFDFKGKRVAVGPPGSGTLVASRTELEVICGLKFDDFKPALLSFSESITAIKDGTVDVGCISAGHPVASLLDLAQHVHVRLIPYTEEELKTLIAKHPYIVRIVIPAGTYQGINTDTLTRGIPTGLFCRQDLTEGMIYQLMRAIYDHPEEKDSIHPQAKQWNLVSMFRGADYATRYTPFHPGSIRYLKEKGVWKEKN